MIVVNWNNSFDGFTTFLTSIHCSETKHRFQSFPQPPIRLPQVGSTPACQLLLTASMLKLSTGTLCLHLSTIHSCYLDNSTSNEMNSVPLGLQVRTIVAFSGHKRSPLTCVTAQKPLQLLSQKSDQGQIKSVRRWKVEISTDL